jgi:hypothetical protein
VRVGVQLPCTICTRTLQLKPLVLSLPQIRFEHAQVMNDEAAAARQAARHAAQQLDAVQREGRDRDAALAEVFSGP